MFSSFDPLWFNFCWKSGLSLILPLFILMSSFWIPLCNILASWNYPISYIKNQLLSTKSVSMKGISSLISTVFLLLMYINLLGMLPILFGISSHIIFTVSIGVPLWLSTLLSSFWFKPTSAMAHLLPSGAPMWLCPFLVLVEFISISVRPITLSFRLAANMTAGHVVLSLLNSFAISGSLKNFMLIFMISTLYIIFEFAICMIQAYIFCLLISLYVNEHP